jgi:23S rRNA (uridine2552-2'-O)-methyltransferase
MGKGYRPKDHFFKKAKQEGFRARSAFKIDEIAKRFQILKRGGRVLDLGAAPGGFLQVIADAVGPSGHVVGIDIVAIRSLNKPNVVTAVFDVLADEFDEQLKALDSGTFDAVVSDMAPKTSGIKSTDEARSLRLATKALEIARARGVAGSSFITKVFMGGDFEGFRADVRQLYSDVKVVRPEATRGSSFEIYLVGLEKRSGPNSPQQLP